MPRPIRLALAVAFAGALALLPATAVQAAITVANTNDAGPGSLRQAIIDAAPGDTIVVPAGTYSLTSGELAIAKSLTISGHSSSDTTIRAGAASRIFNVSGAGNGVAISGVTIRDGLLAIASGVVQGGAISNNGANLTLQNDILTNNAADANGTAGNPGGIAQGGAVWSVDGTLNIVNTKLTDNTARNVGGSGKGGGIAQGGGLFATGAGVTVSGSTFSGNTADSRGGQGPSSSSQGGGIAQGGGVFVSVGSGLVSFTSTTLSGNAADVSGGPGAGDGIGQGGGFYFATSSPTASLLANLTIANNSLRLLGSTGGIGQGGGLFSDVGGSATATLTSATLSANGIEQSAAVTTGGNLYSSGAAANFKIANTIVSGGKGAPGTENCSASPGTSLGFNLDSANQCGFNSGGDQVNKDPLLGPLQDNGGPTQTMAPSGKSPVVDQGAAFGLTTDQRGVQRPIDFPSIPNSSAAGADGSDIGAVELQPSNAITFGKLTKNKENGTAKLTVKVPLPDAGKLKLFGKGLKTKSKPVADTGIVKFAVVGTHSVKKALRLHGKRKVKIKVTYTPTGNSALTKTRTAKLVKK